MMPKTHADHIEPFHPTDYDQRASRWRDEAAIWALCNAPRLATTYNAGSELGVPSCLVDREADYMMTLFATAKVAGLGLETLRGYSESLASTRQSRAGEGQATRAAQALHDWYPTEQVEARMFLSHAAAILYNAEALPEQEERAAAALLRKMGLNVDQVRIGSQTGKGVRITREDMAALYARFTYAAEEGQWPLECFCVSDVSGQMDGFP